MEAIIFVSSGVLLGLLAHLPLVLVLAALGAVVLLRSGVAFGLPLLFWHEDRAKQRAAGAAVVLVACEVLFVAHLLDRREPGQWDWRNEFNNVSPIGHAWLYVFAGLLVVTALGCVVWVIARVLRQRKEVRGEAQVSALPPTAGQRVADERRWGRRSDKAEHGGRPFMQGLGYGALAAMSTLFIAYLLRGPLERVGSATLVDRIVFDDALVPRGPARVPHVVALILSAAFLAYYIVAGRTQFGRHTPATALCALLALLAGIYGVLTFNGVPMTAVVFALAAFLWLGGVPRWRFRLPALAAYYSERGAAPGVRLHAYPQQAAGGVKIAGRTWEEPPARRPLVIACVSGGGIRAAVWSARVLCRLEQALPELPYATRLIFGASGGMVGAAHYVATLPAPGAATKMTRDAANARVAPVEHESLSPTVHRMIYGDLGRALLPFQPSTDRGTVIENAWRSVAGSGLGTTFGQLRAGEEAGWRPSLVFSPMLVEDGRRLLISNADLSHLTCAKGSEIKASEPGKPSPPVPVVDQFYSQSAFEYRLLFPDAFDATPISSAARMSATFPFVTPAVVLPTEPRRRVVDAGYYDNYGVGLAADWIDECLTSHREWLRTHFSGVLVVQVRDGVLRLTSKPGEMPPETSTRGARGAEELTGPLQAIFAAREAGQLFRNDEYLEAISARFRAEGFEEGFFTTVSFEFRGTASLSWSLSNAEKNDLREYANSGEVDAKLENVVAWWRKHSDDARHGNGHAPMAEAMESKPNSQPV